MLVVGGRDLDVSKPLPTAIYDTEACEWRTLSSVGRVSVLGGVTGLRMEYSSIVVQVAVTSIVSYCICVSETLKYFMLVI